MEAADIAEQIQQALEEQNAERRAAERFRTRGAIVIAVQAMLLAISSLGGENATKEMVNANIQASDTWAFYQAKNIRQTSNQIAAEQLEATLMLHGGSLREDDRQRIQRLIERYRATVARYESEPDPKDPGNPSKGKGKGSSGCGQITGKAGGTARRPRIPISIIPRPSFKSPSS